MHAIILPLMGIAFAKPWHKVNSVDIHGNACPAVVRYNQKCPVVCTLDIRNCPSTIAPLACPAGETYCGDGMCHVGMSVATACEGVDNVCSCSTSFESTSASQTSGTLFPCSVDSIKVNVTGYDESDPSRNLPLVEECTSTLGLTPLAGPFLLDCADHPAVQMKSTEPEFVVFYVCLGIESLILLAYYLYRQFQNKALSPDKLKLGEDDETTASYVGSQEFNTIQEVTQPKTKLKQTASLKFTGFTPEFFGSFTRNSIIVATIIWFLIVIILVADYYEVFANFKYKDRSLLFINHENLSWVFIVVWHILTLWLIYFQVNAAWLQTYFYKKVSIHDATHVLIEKPIEAAVQFKGLGKMVETVLEWEDSLRRYTKTNVTLKLTSVKKTGKGRRYIEFECVRYVFNDKTGSFEPWHFEIGPTNAHLHVQAQGLNENEALRRQELDGPNEIVFKIDTFSAGLVKEFTALFYIYQLMMLLIWYYYAYYYMAVCMSFVIVGSGISKVIVSTKAQQRVLEMATFHGHRRVYRDNVWTLINSRDITPGDVIEITADEHSSLSVDCVLVEGDAVVDESSLTGEALPVAKVSVKNDAVVFNQFDAGKVSTLYAGCNILEIRPNSANVPVKAIVLATGASTAKGRLVRDMLYPLPVMFVFSEHLKIVFPILIVWGIIMLIATIFILDATSVDSWFYGMFTVSQVLSPLLPAVLVIGQSISAERLKEKMIMCVDLARITLAGKVKVFCFDKTGTLTKEGLDFMGAHSIQNGLFATVQSDFSRFPEPIQNAMQVCHSLSVVQDRHVGNFVDVEMFKATQSGLELTDGVTRIVRPSHSTGAGNLKVIKRFEFVHSHAYMSVIVQNELSGRMYVFLKGSFEKIKDIVRVGSAPLDYEKVAKNHSASGCYVLAIGYRVLPEGLLPSDVTQWTREKVEEDASAIGLILFRNELKQDTEYVIDALRDGGCRCVMITGDHAQTAVHIARNSGMIRRGWQAQEAAVVLGDLSRQTNLVVWTHLGSDAILSQSEVENLIEKSRLTQGSPVELVVTGAAFNLLCFENWMQQYLFETRIFARMSPEDKVKCVRLHMESHITAMCGDGGNDAGALKAAHAGIALSEAQSSVVAHFSSRDRSLRSCLTLLKEARCSLDVSFSAYKFLLMYGQVLSFLGLIENYFVANMSQAMWVLIDGGTVPICWALTMARPANRLSATRPTARLLGPQTILSVVGQIFINFSFMIITVAVLFRQDFFRCHEFNGDKYDLRRWWELADNYEGSITGVLATFQIMFSAFVFNIGDKYRLGFFRNYVFLGVFGLMFSLLSTIQLADPNAVGCLFHINCGTPDALASIGYSSNFMAPSVYYSASGHNVQPTSFRYTLFGIALLNLVTVTAWEYFVILGPVRNWVLSRISKLSWYRPVEKAPPIRL